MTITSISIEWRNAEYEDSSIFGHMYLVARTADDSASQGSVIDAAPASLSPGYSGPNDLQVDFGNGAGAPLQSFATQAAAEAAGYNYTRYFDGAYWATIDGYGETDPAGTLDNRNSDSITISSLPAPYSSLTLDQLWTSFEGMANSISAAGFVYSAFNISSNSLIESLLASVGVDATTLLTGSLPLLGFPASTTILSTAYTDSITGGFNTQLGFGDSVFENLGGGTHTFNGGDGSSGSLVPYNTSGANSALVLLDVGNGGGLDVSLSSDHTAWLATETIGTNSYTDTCYSMKSINGVHYSTTAPSSNPAIDLGNEASATTFQDLSPTAMATLASQLGITLTDAVQITSASGDISLEVGNCREGDQ